MVHRTFGDFFGNQSVLILASGTRGLGACLPFFGQRTFVDRRFRTSWTEGNSRFIRGDAESAILKLAFEGARFNTVVVLNEGLREDSSAYSLHRQATMGLLGLIVSDSYTHVGSPEYYRAIGEPRWSRMLDVPFARHEIQPEEDDYIAPRYFRSTIRPDRIHQWRMSRVNVGARGEVDGQRFQLRWQSLWCDHDSLDLIVLPESFNCRAGVRIERFTKKPMVTISRFGAVPGGFKTLRILPSFESLVDYCKSHGLRRIGFMPEPFEQAKRIVQCFARDKEWSDGMWDLNFYHLRQDDYDDLYQLSSSHALNR